MKEKIIRKLKNNEMQMPIWVGQLLSYIPYSVRPVVGKYYRINSLVELKI